MLGALSLIFLFSGSQISRAIDVYLHPHNDFLRSSLSPEDASAALSRHLGVEVFEPLRDASNLDYSEEFFVGKGLSNSLLLTMDEADAKAILPPLAQPSFRLSDEGTRVSSLSSVISTYLHRAQHSYTSVYQSDISWRLDDINSLSAFFESAETPSFAAVELKALSELRQRHGSVSQEYIQAVEQIQTFLGHVYNNTQPLRTAVLTFSPSSHVLQKREPQSSQSPLPPNHPPPQEPIGSVSACFSSVDACTEGTNSCSGRGQCLEATKSGRTCFICTCSVTKTGKGSKTKTDTWVGQSCERKDVSGPFVLLTGTTIVMLILVFGSISLLSSVGDHELPSTLLATAIHAKKE